MVDFQIWLVEAFARFTSVAALMHTQWGWPIAESLHFVGLTLLIGTIGVFDLRLLGMGRRIPIATVHRLIPWGLAGFAINVITGVMFMMTEPDQYVYNTSFHLKVLFMLAAGCNALTFYATSFRGVTGPDASPDAPRGAKIIAVLSLSLWMAVIVSGRLLTFYRPYPCEPPGPGLVATCLPGNYEGYSSPREPSASPGR